MKCNEYTTLPRGGVMQLKTDFILKGLDEFLSVKETERKSDKRSAKEIFGDSDNNVTCSEHEGKICELFCKKENCQVPVCTKCISTEHNGHKVAEIETLIQNSKQVVDDLINVVESDIKVTKKKNQVCEDVRREVSIKDYPIKFLSMKSDNLLRFNNLVPFMHYLKMPELS